MARDSRSESGVGKFKSDQIKSTQKRLHLKSNQIKSRTFLQGVKSNQIMILGKKLRQIKS